MVPASTASPSPVSMAHRRCAAALIRAVTYALGHNVTGACEHAHTTCESTRALPAEHTHAVIISHAISRELMGAHGSTHSWEHTHDLIGAHGVHLVETHIISSNTHTSDRTRTSAAHAHPPEHTRSHQSTRAPITAHEGEIRHERRPTYCKIEPPRAPPSEHTCESFHQSPCAPTRAGILLVVARIAHTLQHAVAGTAYTS